MHITEKDAIHLARYLIKGINDSYKERYSVLEIGLNATSTIGVQKKRRANWKFFLKDGKKREKHLNVPLLPQYPAAPDVYPIIMQLINESVLLKDKELDMSKIPIIPSSDSETNIAEIDNISSPENLVQIEQLTLENKSCESMTEESNNKTFFAESKDKKTDIDTSIEEITKEINEVDDLEEATENAYRQEFDFFEPKEPIWDEFSEDDYDNINDNQNKEDTMTARNENIEIEDIKEFTERESHTLVPHSLFNVEQNSYIYMLIQRDPERYVNAIKTMDAILCRNSLKTTTTKFINNLDELLCLYDNDIEKISEELNIDKRDILLCMYEKRML